MPYRESLCGGVIGGILHGQTAPPRRTVGAHRAHPPAGQACRQQWPSSSSQPQRSHGNPVYPSNRNPLGVSPAGDGLWKRHDLLAPPREVATPRRLGQTPRGPAGEVAGGGPDRLVTCGRRQLLRSGRFWGVQTGPNPTDRRKLGSKHHVITDGQGVPLAFKLTGANRHDVTQLIPLVDAIPPVRGKVGHPRQRPDVVLGDRAYDSGPHRRELENRGIDTLLAHRNVPHGSGLGVLRWVVERTLSWLNQFRRLRVRYERRPEIHEAFLSLGCACICFNVLSRF